MKQGISSNDPLFFVGLSVAQDFKSHENEGLVGYALLLIRFGLFKWFRNGASALLGALSAPAARRSEPQSLRRGRSKGTWEPCVGGVKLQNFLQIFELLGSAYFLAFPTIFLFVQALERPQTSFKDSESP